MPVPLAPPVIVIQGALLTAVHVQLEPVVMLNDSVRPVTGTEAPVAASEYVQVPPACVTVKVWPPTVMVPVRDDVVGFAATV